MNQNILNTVSLLLQLLVGGIPIEEEVRALTKQLAEKLQTYIDRYNAGGGDMTDAEVQEFRDLASAAVARLNAT